LLHVAPEPALGRLLSGRSNIDYLSGDLGSPFAMVKMDITNIPYPDGHFDAIYCSHVLEHVPNDQQAMGEFFRVLKPNGWAILQVPIEGEHTFEDWSVQTPEGRERAFGQSDHVRIYGRDYRDRLAKAGFTVTVDPFISTFSDADIRRLGLGKGEDVFYCTKLR
jgi:SAM-dependent methyltransferase